jgi:hypothetical protein
VSLRVVSASTKPWSSATWVSFPVRESIAATGLGAEAAAEDEDDEEEDSSLLPHAAADRLVAAIRATAATVLRDLLENVAEKMVLMGIHIL